MDKQFEIFSMLKKGFTNSFSLLPILKELYDEVELLTPEQLNELTKQFPKIAEILEKVRNIIS